MINNQIITQTTCILLELTNGKKLGFTEFDQDLIIDKIIYKAKPGFNSSCVTTSLGLQVDNFEVTTVIDDDDITELAILAGEFDCANIMIFTIDYINYNNKSIIKIGTLGEINIIDNKFIFEIRGITEKFNNNLRNRFSPICRVKFGGKECGVNEDKFSTELEINEIVKDKYIFKIFGIEKFALGTFNYGELIFLSGKNKGNNLEIIMHQGYYITLVVPTPYQVSKGDKVKLVAGCDKNFKTCCEKFNNAINFRGEPHLPGIENIYKSRV